MKVIKGYYHTAANGKVDSYWIEIGGKAYGIAEFAGHEYKYDQKNWFIPEEESDQVINLKKYFGNHLTEITLKFKE